MKRHGHLWPQVMDFSNLLAARQAHRGKCFRNNVLAFNYHLETELLKIQAISFQFLSIPQPRKHIITQSCSN